VYAHSVLQRQSGLGYTSEWATKNFDNVVEKNDFFEQLGSSLQPAKEDNLGGLSEDVKPKELLTRTES